MTTICTGDFPRMLVSTLTSENRRKWHLENKIIPLINNFKRQIFIDTIIDTTSFIKLCEINALSDGMRMYVAAFPNDPNNSEVPSGYAGTLTLIYTPCKKNGEFYYDSGPNNYFYFHPFKGLKFITKNVAKVWVNDYRDNILPELTKIVNANGGSSVYDTKSLFHKVEDFIELKKEFDCQEAKFVKVCFTSYTNKETDSNVQLYLSRLTVGFELIDEYGMKIDVVQRPRMKVDSAKMITDFNNAELCPPLKCDQDPF